MRPEQITQLDADLRSSTQAIVYGPKQKRGGFKGMWSAPSSKGWRVWVDTSAMLVKAGKDDLRTKDRTRPIDEVGEIHIHVNGDDHPSIFWRRDDDGNLVRETF